MLKEINWKQEPIVLFGKKIMQPRLTAWIGDPAKTYTYSGLTLVPQAWIESLIEIKNRVEKLTNVRLTSALLNQYRDGNDSMGWHSDNEKELGLNPTICSVSFGATRTFKFRHRKNPELKASVELTNGSVLVMQGPTQHHWLHSISKMKNTTAPRINITFRRIN